MNIRFVLPLAALALLAACKQKPAEAPAPAEAPPVATVDGKALSADMLDTYVKAAAGRPSSELNAEQRNNAIDALIRLQLLANEAEKQGIQKDKEVAAVLEMSRLQVLQSAVTSKYLKGKEPTEQELRAEYDAQIAAAPRTDYRIRHIQVQSEEFANQLIGRLQKGARFDQLAAQNSADEASKARGGDLGFVSPAANLPAPFIQAMLALKPGEITTVPVATPVGFHIIKLEETRPSTMPTFEQVKDRVTQIVTTKKIKAYTDELLKTAKVERK